MGDIDIKLQSKNIMIITIIASTVYMHVSKSCN